MNVEQAAVLRPAERHGEFGDAEQADRDRHEADAVAQLGIAEGHARHAGVDVDADEPEQQPDKHHRDRLRRRAMREHDRAGEAEQHQAEIFRRGEFEREPAHRHAGGDDDDGRDRAGEERCDGGDRERRAGAALLRHLVPVETGDDGGGFARQIDQDRGGRAAILRAVENAGEHDQRRRRRQREGERQQDRDRGDRRDARQHADQRADQRAQQAEAEIGRRERDAETRWRGWRSGPCVRAVSRRPDRDRKAERRARTAETAKTASADGQQDRSRASAHLGRKAGDEHDRQRW